MNRRMPPHGDKISASLPLTIVDEVETFAQVSTVEDLRSANPEPGLRLEREPPLDIIGGELVTWLVGRVGGPSASVWDYGLHVRIGATELCRVGPVWWFPRYGALIDAEGNVPVSAAGEALHNWARLDPLPGLSAVGDALSFALPADAPHLSAGSVALPWGMSNYGHFVFDGLASVLAVEEVGLLDRFPLRVPPLTPWQKTLVDMTFGDLALEEIAAPIVHLDGAVFSTSMDHYLHRPGPLIARLRERIRQAIPASGRPGRRLYISRRSQYMRIMIDEAALEAALLARGFEIIRPERLEVTEQIRLFREASVVVGASGAGLANALIADEGAKVIEIQPINFTSFWTAAFCRAVGLDWSGYICPSPCPSEAAPWLSRLRRSFRFAYRLNVPEFLVFLDARL